MQVGESTHAAKAHTLPMMYGTTKIMGVERGECNTHIGCKNPFTQQLKRYVHVGKRTLKSTHGVGEAEHNGGMNVKKCTCGVGEERMNATMQ